MRGFRYSVALAAPLALAVALPAQGAPQPSRAQLEAGCRQIAELAATIHQVRQDGGAYGPMAAAAARSRVPALAIDMVDEAWREPVRATMAERVAVAAHYGMRWHRACMEAVNN